MLNSLQACRAIAAILVVFYHTSHGIFRLPKYFGNKPFGPIFDFGYAGVDFFFVLSGFMMMYVHAADIGKPSALAGYLWKRFSRIYPAYWVVLAAVIPVYFLIPHFGFGYERDADVIASSILLWPHPETHLVLGVAWTLVFEVFFYGLFGLLILNRRLGLTVFALWSICVCAFPMFEAYPWTFLFSFLNLRFLAGIGVAYVVQHWQTPMPRLVAALGTIIFLGTGIFDAFNGPLSALGQTAGYTLGSALTLLGLVQAERAGRIAPPGWLVYLGNASYAIYLVHFLALSVIAKISKAGRLEVHLPGVVLFGIHVVGAIMAGCIFHHLVESPLHFLTKRYFRRDRPAAPAVAPEIRQAA